MVVKMLKNCISEVYGDICDSAESKRNVNVVYSAMTSRCSDVYVAQKAMDVWGGPLMNIRLILVDKLSSDDGMDYLAIWNDWMRSEQDKERKKKENEIKRSV